MTPRGNTGWTRVAIAGLLVAATALVYYPVVGHEFLNFDDLAYVVDNPYITAPATPGALLSHFVTPYLANWLPVYWMSLHVTYALHGASPAAFLLTNLAIHLLSTVLLFVALARMTGATWQSAFVAGVFALHPLHVESVAWITERKDVLGGLFFMLGLYAYSRYVEAPQSRTRYAAVISCFALGVMSKQSVVMFPLVLLLLDYWPLCRLTGSVRRVIDEKIPLLAIAVVAAGITYATQEAVGQMRVGDAISLLARSINAVESYAFYLSDAVWPSGLAALYPHPYLRRAPNAQDLAIAGGITVLFALATGVGLARRRSQPYLVVGWVWYLATLVPMIGIVQVGLQARADRYMYVPLVGLAIALAFAVGDIAGRSRLRQRVAVAAGTAALVGLAVASHHQIPYWRNTIALYERIVTVTEGNGYAHEMLGNELALHDRNREAASHFEEAARLDPGRVKSFFGLAVTRDRLGQTEGAIAAYQAGLRLQPNKVRAHGELGILLTRTGNHDEAIVHLERALTALPDEQTFQAALAAAKEAQREDSSTR